MLASLLGMGGRNNLQLVCDPIILAIHLFVTTAKLLRPSGARAVTAESLLLMQQFIV
ncbi:MAG: hypothetical protein WCD07_00110 [Burkholderiales bacterium]